MHVLDDCGIQSINGVDVTATERKEAKAVFAAFTEAVAREVA